MAVTENLRDSIKRMQTGDETAFAAFYEQTYSYVYAKAKYVMHEEEDALDLTQETFIQAYRGIGSIEDINNVYAWLGGIVYRQGMRIFNKKKEVLTGEEEDYLFEELVSDEATPEESMDEQETVNIVKGIIDELPELQRVAIMAFYYDNMKIDDIAVMCDCSPNTIKSRLNYAKKFLKEKVEEHEKTHNYKLHSLSPVILLLAFKGLFAEQAYRMPLQAVKSVYAAACESLGIGAAAVTAVAEGVAALSQATATEGVAAGEAVSEAVASLAGETASTAGAAAAGEAASGAVASLAGGAAAGAAKVGIGVKIAIAAASTLVVAGVGTAVGVAIYNNQEEKPVVMEETTTAEELYDSNVIVETEESTAEEESTVEEETSEDDDREPSPYEGLYTSGIFSIEITNYEYEDYRAATFDMKFVRNDEENGITETVIFKNVSEVDGLATPEGTSDLGNQWFLNMRFLDEPGAIIWSWDARLDGDMISLTSQSLPIFVKEEKKENVSGKVPEPGTYICSDGAPQYASFEYILRISDVDTDGSLKMEYDIAPFCKKVDMFITETDYVYMDDGIYTFYGKTGFGLPTTGYMYVNDNGDIMLSFVSYGMEDINWHGAYPTSSYGLITFKKQTD